MSTPNDPSTESTQSIPQLHVFEQDGAWHWGITVSRVRGGGFKLIAYSDRPFSMQSSARIDGDHALAKLAEGGTVSHGAMPP
jgi:hypothetical protein